MSPNKIGLIITSNTEAWKGEAGKGEYYKKRFSKVDNTFDYEVIYGVTGSLPDISEFPNYLGFVISGSHHSVNDPYQWIMNLQNFIIQLDQYNKETDNKPVRLFGICFGHQIIAKTFGGLVQPIANNKWIYGAEKIIFNSTITPESWFQKALKCENEVMMCQVHSEEVSKVPNNAIVVAASNTCETEALAYGGNIFSTQGHPEFEIEVMTNLVGCNFLKNNMITSEEFEIGKQQVETVPYDLVTGFVLGFLKH
ncbi:uncharacterized protein [Clytia hemisphaerica]|uniref:Glutamine amidotransferase domain-containing protein n=1 Tax=Clytia hemisphaerica TaxID=252671 RepID=A0A7M5WQY9_9CNID|eukprot:TCONS_00028865-protein